MWKEDRKKIIDEGLRPFLQSITEGMIISAGLEGFCEIIRSIVLLHEFSIPSSNMLLRTSGIESKHF